ncbi:MAG: hypothetical protein COS99_05120 [Candidatus Omnitrophica bacterium CG07_land_8_20_14_0_80_42_15]|uniref:NADH-quinone oxidoreductase subunit J n=1 Tax=Candidatus Aquitaenariimonas noxiae TaxID=1974741 RepID=A0A2J0KSH2_9BACT|nr:MAG: hypothetical protein COS99_05120 [Candidatus Omnitrophica bacterium CG07_land_8_20_14_0_80_42_15]
MTINIILLIAMTIATLWTVMGRSLLKATLGLAVTSVVISVLMFRLDSPMAAVFELSVCAGLITIIFVSAISLVKPLTHKEAIVVSKDRMKRFRYLPLLVILFGVIAGFFGIPNDFKPIYVALANDVRTVLWSLRQFDMFGQIVIIIAGALGVVVLFREKEKR